MLPATITTIPGIERAVSRAITEATTDLAAKLQSQLDFAASNDKKLKASGTVKFTITAVGGDAYEVHATVKASGTKIESTASEVVNANGIVARVADTASNQQE